MSGSYYGQHSPASAQPIMQQVAPAMHRTNSQQNQMLWQVISQSSQMPVTCTGGYQSYGQHQRSMFSAATTNSFSSTQALVSGGTYSNPHLIMPSDYPPAPPPSAQHSNQSVFNHQRMPAPPPQQQQPPHVGLMMPTPPGGAPQQSLLNQPGSVFSMLQPDSGQLQGRDRSAGLLLHQGSHPHSPSPQQIPLLME